MFGSFTEPFNYVSHNITRCIHLVRTPGEADSFNAHCSALIAADTCQIWWKFSGGWHAHPERLCLSAGACVVVPAEWRRTQWPCFTSCWYAGVICIATKHHLCIVSVLRGLSGRECMGRPSPGPPFLQSGIPRPKRAFSSMGTHIPRPETVLSIGTQLVNLNLVKITAWLEIRGARWKIEKGHRFLRGSRDFYRSHYIKITP